MLIGYELVMTLLFLAALVWVLRSRNPISLGALVGGFMLCGFDWLWCSRGFWNATVNPNLMTMIPGIDIQGQRYPFSICFIWAVGFGMVPLLASRAHDRIGRVLGVLHFPVILLAGAVIDWVVETICVHDLQVWTYHQAPQYLLRGVPWSNSWFLGGLLALSYFGLARVRRWTAIEDGAGLSPANEQTWKGLQMASAAILVPAFLLGTAQLFWWSAVTPWVESGRLF